MASHSTSNFESALLKKGFKKEVKHHNMFWYYHNGKKTSLRTRTSHGEKEFNDSIFSERKKQLKFSKPDELKKYMDCTITKEMYDDFLVKNKHIEP